MWKSMHIMLVKERLGQIHLLREFHNYIKDKLIRSVTTISNSSISILDTSIGRGGDIGKYLRSGNVNFLLGLDISPDVNVAAKYYLFKEINLKPCSSNMIQVNLSKVVQVELANMLKEINYY